MANWFVFGRFKPSGPRKPSAIVHKLHEKQQKLEKFGTLGFGTILGITLKHISNEKCFYLFKQPIEQ